MQVAKSVHWRHIGSQFKQSVPLRKVRSGQAAKHLSKYLTLPGEHMRHLSGLSGAHASQLLSEQGVQLPLRLVDLAGQGVTQEALLM